MKKTRPFVSMFGLKITVRSSSWSHAVKKDVTDAVREENKKSFFKKVLWTYGHIFIKVTKKKAVKEPLSPSHLAGRRSNKYAFSKVLPRDVWEHVVGVCWLGFKTSACSTWRVERSVSACCWSPPGPSWRWRSGVGWSPSPGRTISHNTLRRRCCLRRKAADKI